MHIKISFEKLKIIYNVHVLALKAEANVPLLKIGQKRYYPL